MRPSWHGGIYCTPEKGVTVGASGMAVGGSVGGGALVGGSLVKVGACVTVGAVVAVFNGSVVATFGTFNLCPNWIFTEDPRQLAR